METLFAYIIIAIHPGLVTGGISRLWPLVPEHPNAEVIAGGTLIKDACAIGEGQGHPSLDYSSIRFLGTPNSFVDLYIDGSHSYSDFSFIFFLGNPISTGATIFHYQQNPTVSDGNLKEVKLSMHGRYFKFEITSSDGEVFEAQASNAECFPTTAKNDWLQLGVTFDRSKHLMSFVTSETTVAIAKASLPDTHLGTPGTLRVGTNLDQTDTPYNGRITCIGLITNVADYEDIEDMLSDCRTDEWDDLPTTFARESCIEPDSGRYRRVARDYSPLSGSIYAMTQISRLLCASECDRLAGCESFAHGEHACELFNTVDVSHLGHANGLDFYIKSSPCC